MKMIVSTIFGCCALLATAQDKPEIPDDLLDDDHFRDDSALNEFTIPSIAKVFNELEKVSPLSYNPVITKTTNALPSTGPESR
jgi:hypothetical protein